MGEASRIVATVCPSPSYDSSVGFLSWIRVPLIEVGDFERFPNAKAFQSYLGLNVSERSSGETSAKGGITLTGNALVRKLLVEAAWTYMRPRAFRSDCAAEGVPAHVVEHARKGCLRLKKRAQHLQRRGKKGCVVNVAVARELAGWVWALATM